MIFTLANTSVFPANAPCQPLGTADGFRHCQSSVMGPWSSWTRLRWRWSEFRFETRFTTPEIQLLTSSEIATEERRVRRQWSWRRFQYVHAGTQPFEVTSDDPLCPKALRETINLSRRKRGTDLVTWTRLLRSLHQYQAKLNIDEAESCKGTECARVTARINEWSWDLVPPDFIRPYATSTVGTMVRISHRLGMHWQKLDPGRGEMNAEGNGHDFSCTSIRGLGIVLQYNYNSRLDPLRVDANAKHCGIPTHSADKLRCGIIFSSKETGIGEHSLIGADGEHGLLGLGGCLRNLNVDRAALGVLTDRQHLLDIRRRESDVRHVLNDMVCLVCPYLPLKGDCKNAITWPILTSGLGSPLFFWEGRKTLYQRLRQYVDENQAPTPTPLKVVSLSDEEKVFLHPRRENLSEVALKHMTSIQDKYESNFYCKWATAVMGDAQTTQFLDFLRSVYDDVTLLLQSHQDLDQPQHPGKHYSTLNYAPLVGAHLTMATEIGRPARERLNGKDARSYPPDPKSAGLVPYMFEVAHHYVDNLGRVVELVRNRGCDLPTEEIEGMWWLLMVRGICWSMSVNVSLQESVVPSYLYYSATPVYII